MRAPGAIALALLGATLALPGCFGGWVRPHEVPDAPIAISYRTKEEARRNAEDWQDEQEGILRRRAANPDENELVPRVDEINLIFSALMGRSQIVEAQLGRLALLDPRTGEVQVIEAALRGSIPLAWSPDRERLLFVQAGDLDLQLWEYRRSTETVRPLTHGPPAHTQGCYGPGGRIIASAVDTRENPPRSVIVISQPGGRHPYRVLSPGPVDHSPACAPDGSAIAFVRRDERGREQIVSLSPVIEGQPRRLSPGRQPSFSSDGQWIVFSAEVRRAFRTDPNKKMGWKLWRVRPDGTGRAPIGDSIRDEQQPSLSPDGKLVVYVASEEEPRRHLYVRRFDGSGDRILFSDGDGDHPVW